jgi:hypothetical protein
MLNSIQHLLRRRPILNQVQDDSKSEQLHPPSCGSILQQVHDILYPVILALTPVE